MHGSASKARKKEPQDNRCFTCERRAESACGWDVTFPVEIFLINLRQIPLGCFIRKKVLIKPRQGGLAGKVSPYRDLGGKKFRLNGCWATNIKHKRRRPDEHHAARCPEPHRVLTDTPRPEEAGAPGHSPCASTVGAYSQLSVLTVNGQYSGQLSVLRPMVGAHSRWSASITASATLYSSSPRLVAAD